MMTPLQKYMMQRGMGGAGAGPQGGGMGGAGSNGGSVAPSVPMGPGIADPYTEGDSGPSLTNPEDDFNEFDPRRRPRAYMGGMPSG